MSGKKPFYKNKKFQKDVVDGIGDGAITGAFIGGGLALVFAAAAAPAITVAVVGLGIGVAAKYAASRMKKETPENKGPQN